MEQDAELVERYVQARDQEAFGELVRRHGDWVYSAAKRQLGDGHLAEDVTQAVFVLLARKAGGLLGYAYLQGWLFRATSWCVKEARRQRASQARREREVAAMRREESETADWEMIAPELDEAVGRLGKGDREAVLLRFYRGMSLAEVGQGLGVSEEAAKKRVQRAVERLRGVLARKGVVAGAAALSVVMAERVVEAAPVGVVGSVATGVGSGIAEGAAKMMAWVKIRAVAAVVLAAVALGVGGWLGWGHAAGLTGPVIAGPVAVAPAKETPAPLPAPVPKGKYFDFQAVDSVTRQGIPDAALTIRMATEMRQESLRQSAGKTDGQGKYRIGLPERELVLLQVSASKEGLVPMVVTWQANQLRGGLVPSYALKMEKGTEIGGVVRDEQGNPVAGASVRITVPPENGEGSDHPLVDILGYEVKADAQGKWRCGIMPGKLREVWVTASHPKYPSGDMASGRPSVDALRGMSAISVLRKDMGPDLRGKVVDAQSGRGIAGVKVRQGQDRWGTRDPVVATDGNGEYRFANARVGKVTLTAQGKGYMPEMVEVDVQAGMEPVEFRLRQGAGFSGQVVDAAGNPVQGATVVADTWRRKRTIEWEAQTDVDGRFVWEDAPADEVTYHIVKRGLVSHRSAKGIGGDDGARFTLVKETKIHGKLVDADTGMPIPRFRVTTGLRYVDRWYWDEQNSRVLADGWYEASFNEPAEEYAVRIEADGYLPQVTEGVKAGTEDATRDVKLKRGMGPRGVVKTADGQPVLGAQIVIASDETIVQVRDGKLTVRSASGRGTPEEMVTDAGGRFSAPPQLHEARLVVVHETGMAMVEVGPEMAAELTVTLQPWASMEGTLRWGKAVQPNKKLCAYVAYAPQRPSMVPRCLEVSARAVSDAQGHFVLTHLPAARLSVDQMGQQTGDRVEMLSGVATVEPKPGDRICQDVGGKGVRVVARVELPKELAGKTAYASLLPASQRVEYPENWDQMSMEERQQWWKGRTTAQQEWKPSHTQGFFVGGTGNVEFCDVEAGMFEVRVDVTEGERTLARISHEVNVGSGTPDDVIDLGVLKLEMAQRLEVGKAAVPLKLRLLDGSMVKTDALRGKWLLVTTWTTWISGWNGHKRPEDVMRDVLARCGGEEKVATVTILCDQRIGWAKRYLAKHPIPGAVVYAGPEGGEKSNELDAYFAARGVLIDPDGIVRAVELQSQGDIVEAVGKAVK